MMSEERLLRGSRAYKFGHSAKSSSAIEPKWLSDSIVQLVWLKTTLVLVCCVTCCVSKDASPTHIYTVITVQKNLMSIAGLGNIRLFFYQFWHMFNKSLALCSSHLSEKNITSKQSECQCYKSDNYQGHSLDFHIYVQQVQTNHFTQQQVDMYQGTIATIFLVIKSKMQSC